MTNKYFLFLKPKFFIAIMLSFMFAIIPIRQYRNFIYDYDTNSQGLGLGFADWFFRFELAVILIIPFLLTWYWLNEAEQIQNFEKNNGVNRINTKSNMAVSFLIFFLLGHWLYNFGTDTV